MGISIHALRGEGDWAIRRLFLCCRISIHALRGEGDPLLALEHGVVLNISIHALRGEGDRGILEALPLP